MTTDQLNQYVLSAYPEGFWADDVFPLDRLPSLDRSRHWKVRSPDGIFCLRRRPVGQPTLEQLQFQQAVLWHVVCEGIDFVPLPFETTDHRGFVPFENAFWELLPWIAGTEALDGEYFLPDCFPALDGERFETTPSESAIVPTPTLSESFELHRFQMVAAMMSLAQFHLAASTFPLPNGPLAVSPKACSDKKRWEGWISGRFARLFRVLTEKRRSGLTATESRLVETGWEFLNSAVTYSGSAMVLLSRASRLPVPIQPVIGNCCFRHLRFDDEGLCGMIDFKAIGIDGAASDVASLLASMAREDAALWNFGLKAYQAVRPLSDHEIFLVRAFDLPSIFLEGLDYLAGVFLHHAVYAESQLGEITRRLAEWNRRLEYESRDRRPA